MGFIIHRLLTKGDIMKSLEEREQREYERRQIIKNAVEAADRIILDGSDGSIEETNFLTARVAWSIFEKALMPFGTMMLSKDLE